MSYLPANLLRMAEAADGAAKWFLYRSADPLAAVLDPGYIADAGDHDMSVGDLVLVQEAASPVYQWLEVARLVGGAADLVDGLLPPEGLAPITSPRFNGTPLSPTPGMADATRKIATTEWVQAQAYLRGNQRITLSGDVTGTGTTHIKTTVAGFGGNPISTTQPQDGQILVWNGVAWQPAPPVGATGPQGVPGPPGPIGPEGPMSVGSVHGVRISTVSTTLNNAVANGGILRFDTVHIDSDGFVPTTAPFDTITIPAGLGGIYLLSAWSSGSGTQATTLGMGILLNGAQLFSETNQSISGPGSVNYTLDNGAVEIGRLQAGDIIQLRNNSVSAGTNVFRSTTLSLVRIEPAGVQGPQGLPGEAAAAGTLGQVQVHAAGGVLGGVTMSGDATWNTATGGLALAAVNANVGTFQGLTLDAKGRVTAAANMGYTTAAAVAGAYLPLAGGTLSGTLAVGGNINPALAIVPGPYTALYSPDGSGTAGGIMLGSVAGYPGNVYRNTSHLFQNRDASITYASFDGPSAQNRYKNTYHSFENQDGSVIFADLGQANGAFVYSALTVQHTRDQLDLWGGIALLYGTSEGGKIGCSGQAEASVGEVIEGNGRWGGYFEGRRKEPAFPGQTYGIEVDVGNWGPSVVVDPYNYALPAASGYTIGILSASGCGITPTSPASIGVMIGQNTQRWNKGLVFGYDGLVTALGAGGNGVAIELARGQSLRWVNSAGGVDAEIWGDAGGPHLGALPYLPLAGGTLSGNLHGQRSHFGSGEIGSNWLETLRPGASSWTSLVALAPLGGPPIQVGVVGAMRSSDPTIDGARLIIGTEGVAINDNTSIVHSAWAGYFEAWRKAGCASGSQAIGIEIDVAECNSGITANILTPYAYPANFTAALWLGSGANLSAEVGVPVYPASVALGITPNGAIFRKGVVVLATALDTAIGAGGNGVAVELARGQSLRWMNSGGTTDAEIWGDVGGLYSSVSLISAGSLHANNNVNPTINATALYSAINAPDGTGGPAAIILGAAADPHHYYRNTIHRFQSRDGLTDFATINSAGLSLATPLSIANGGTGATTAAAARTNLGIISGMTAGQIPIAATATTITSSGNLSGAVTTSGSLATTLANNAVATAHITNANVTYAKIQNVAANRLLGNSTGSAAAPAEIALPLAVALGGTNATTAAAALTSLGAAPLASPSFTGGVNLAGTFNSSGSAAGYIFSERDTATPWTLYASGGYARFFTGSADKLTIHSSGALTIAGSLTLSNLANPQLGIQFTDYTALASPDGLTDGRAIYVSDAAAGSIIYYRNNTHTFQNVGAGVTYASIAAAGTTIGTPTGGAKGAGTLNATAVYGAGVLLTSDARLKRDITPLPDNCLQLVTAVAPKRFRFIPREDGPPGFWERRNWGFIAQDVQAVLPDAVEEDGEGNLSYSPSDLLGCLWSSVRELSEKVQELEARHGA